MKVEDLAAHQRPHLVRAERDYMAFVPPPLPPELDFDKELTSALSTADRAMGELAGIGRTLPNATLLAHSMVRREAVLSSRIEGTQATMPELVLFEVQPQRDTPGSDVREVFNYITALEHLLDPNRSLPLSLRLLREAHEILLTDVYGGGHATPGELRRSQNWIGAPGCTLNTASYVPPPPERLWECLDAFEKYLHAEHTLPPLVTIACLHYQFEAIHPFIDGNGRLGRLLVTLLLVEWGLLPAPLLDLSAYLEPRRDEYYARLLSASTDGDWAGWITFFLKVLAHQAADARDRAVALHRLRESYRTRVTSARSSSLLPQLVDTLFETPALTINRAARTLGVTHRTAAQNIGKLVDAGVLIDASTSTRSKIFLAQEILRTVDGST